MKRSSPRLSQNTKVCYNEASLAKQQHKAPEKEEETKKHGRRQASRGKKQTKKKQTKKQQQQPKAKKQNLSSSIDVMELLPDDLLVRIGMTVAKLGSLKDYVSFATASKRNSRLLRAPMWSQSEVCATRLSEQEPTGFYYPTVSWKPLEKNGHRFKAIQQAEDDNEKGSLTLVLDHETHTWYEKTLSWEISVPFTLEQLGFYETVSRVGLLHHSKINCIPCEDDFGETMAFLDPRSMPVIWAARTILRTFSKATLLIEAHSPTEETALLSTECAELAVNAINNQENPDWKQRICMRAWGDRAHAAAVRGNVAKPWETWAEVYACHPGPNGDIASAVRYPSRPEYYFGRPLGKPERVSQTGHEKSKHPGGLPAWWYWVNPENEVDPFGL